DDDHIFHRVDLRIALFVLGIAMRWRETTCAAHQQQHHTDAKNKEVARGTSKTVMMQFAASDNGRNPTLD
ncbi:MAG TPA: hypothetical protein PK018_11335, partial [Candidatus Competibacter sp.]|nr:hypothetical protein [Candidatus Competibacter sp.]